MGPCANTADTLGKGPCVARIASFQDHFQPAPHCTSGYGVADDPFVINVHLAAHMPFDARYRVYDNALAAIVKVKAIWRLNNHDQASSLDLVSDV